MTRQMELLKELATGNSLREPAERQSYRYVNSIFCTLPTEAIEHLRRALCSQSCAKQQHSVKAKSPHLVLDRL